MRFPGKLGMCPSLAEPDSGGFPKSSVSHETKQKLLLEKPIFCLPACCNCPVALSEFTTCFIKTIQLQIGKFQEMQLQQENQTAKLNLLRKYGLLAHTSAAFLKNCCTEKLFICLRLVSCNQPQTTPTERS